MTMPTRTTLDLDPRTKEKLSKLINLLGVTKSEAIRMSINLCSDLANDHAEGVHFWTGKDRASVIRERFVDFQLLKPTPTGDDT